MSQTGRAAHLTHRGVLKAFIVAERKQQGAASDLFKLAKQCPSVTEFNQRCEEAEEFFLSREAGQDQVQQLPAKYIQARSDIRGAFDRGLDLTRIKSYYQMKKLKVAAGKQQSETPEPEANDGVIVLNVEREAPAESTATVREDGVIVLSEPGSAGGDRPRRQRSMRDSRERKPVVTVEEALANGDVVDAKTNMIVPEELTQLVQLFPKLNEHARARFAKQWTKQVRDALSQQGQRRGRGNQSAHRGR